MIPGFMIYSFGWACGIMCLEFYITMSCYIDQFDSIGLNVFDNCWSNIHDFDRGLDQTNWGYLPTDSPPLISLPTEGEFSNLGLSLETDRSIVPLTVGSNSRPEGEVRLI